MCPVSSGSSHLVCSFAGVQHVAPSWGQQCQQEHGEEQWGAQHAAPAGGWPLYGILDHA